jgi:hypothetical protein
MVLRHLPVLIAFICLSCAFFWLALDNGFWQGDDFLMLEHSLMMRDGTVTVFDSTPPYKFQPLVHGLYYLLFNLFLFNAKGYFIFNMLLHGLNSYLVFLLVNTLLKDRTVALISGVLFVFTVGSYGKSVMIVSGCEDLVITALTLLTMIFYFRNELYAGGRLLSPWFVLVLIFFFASMLTQSTSFSIIGAFLAFKFFFRLDTHKRIISADFLVLLAIAAAALVIKTTVFNYTPTFYTRDPGPLRFLYYAAKNLINYPVRMIFPIHTSHLVTEAGAAVRFIYMFATEIRILIALTVISYSIFGFIFGNHTIRFFIAWTYIMVLPFAFFQFPHDWLNIRHLYIVSVGFIMVISAGAVYCMRLISHQSWKRFFPMIVPLFFIILARFIVTQLDRNYELKVASPKTAAYREDLAKNHPYVIIDGYELRIDE